GDHVPQSGHDLRETNWWRAWEATGPGREAAMTPQPPYSSPSPVRRERAGVRGFLFHQPSTFDYPLPNAPSPSTLAKNPPKCFNNPMRAAEVSYPPLPRPA